MAVTFFTKKVTVYNMKKVLYIDDDSFFLKEISEHVRDRFPGIELVTCQDPIAALTLIDGSLDLLMMDLEMPRLDGKKLLSYAISQGLDKRKIVIISSREADYLHEVFPMGACLCVLNKHELRQREALDMILDSVEKK